MAAIPLLPEGRASGSRCTPAGQTVMVVGGYGAVGREVGRLLAEEADIAVILAGRSLDKALQVSGAIGAQARWIDLLDGASWEQACIDVDCVVMCMDQPDTRFVEFLFERGIDYVDITAGDAFLRMVEWLAPRRSRAMISVGLAPGLTNMLAAHLIGRLDRIDRLEIGLLAGLGDSHGDAGLAWIADRLFDPARPRRGARFAFGFGQGQRTAHPLDFADQHALRRTLAVPEATTSLCLESRLATRAVFSLAAACAGSRLARNATVALFRRLRLGSAVCAISVHAHGRSGSRRVTASAHFAGEGESATTAAIAALQIAAFLRAPPPAGVWHSHQILDCSALLGAMERRSIGRVAIEPLRNGPDEGASFALAIPKRSRRPLASLALAIAAVAAPVSGQTPGSSGEIAQFYSYRLTDPARFREGYRAHLSWHARHGDSLVWYAWTIQSGARRGLFIDGTAGATWDELDSRPDLPGDGADFAATAGPHAAAVDIETWELWRKPSTAAPLEDRTPAAILDVFLFEVAPGQATTFEQAVAGLAEQSEGGPARLTWYRKLRGGTLPAYMLVLSRERWSDIALTGATLPQLLARTYRSSEAAAEAVLGLAMAISVETWAYEPRLSLFPGRPLPP